MLIRLNLLCSLLEITILPPPGGPIEANKCMPCWTKMEDAMSTSYNGKQVKLFSEHISIEVGLITKTKTKANTAAPSKPM